MAGPKARHDQLLLGLRRRRLFQDALDLVEASGLRHAAAADRAGVLIAGPLGLCFLPAFVCLGIVPVVAGLAGDIFGSGLL